MSKPRVAINGFGRIGRTLLRVLLQRNEVEVVAINDLADVHTMSHLFKYDSVHGKWPGSVVAESSSIMIDGHAIPFFSEKKVSDLPWENLQVDIVVECTGTFKTASDLQQHLEAGAKKALLSAPPADNSLKTIVLGVNDHQFSVDDQMLSCASCTTNSAAPMIQLVEEYCGIESAYITTVHSYTGDQRLHDAPHKDWRRGRAAATSIVPTSTGAAKALTRVFPHLADKMGGCGMRVPVPDGSLTDITFIVKKTITVDALNAAFKEAAEGRMKGILEYTEEPIVSRDVIDNPHSCLFDAELTSVIGNMVKVVGWYDNEYGYSNRLADMIQRWNG
ncbi:MAG: Glyceraldehyde-3-phosphate dehydrogenase [Bacteroidota bacterium]|jgi:glyceraldehyde 3-phosphate dehydrogenase